MKKYILLISAVAFMISSAKAQNAQERTILFGFKAGTNYSDAYEQKNLSFNTQGKFGLSAGAFLAVCIGDLVCVQPELMFSQKGFKATSKAVGNAFSFTRTTSYVDIPVLLALKPNEFVKILFGPQYSYLLQQKDVSDTNALTVEQENQFKDVNTRKNIFGIVGGVDVNVQNFVIGARLGWDVKNNSMTTASTTPQYKNAWAQATLGFKIF